MYVLLETIIQRVLSQSEWRGEQCLEGWETYNINQWAFEFFYHQTMNDFFKEAIYTISTLQKYSRSRKTQSGLEQKKQLSKHLVQL
jgi:hypothetical protein